MTFANMLTQALFFLCCLCQCQTGLNHTPTTQPMLQLKVVFKTAPIYLNRPLQTEITLTNAGDSTILVNKRMEMGYAISISRELYVEMVNEENGQSNTHSLAKINRDDPAPTDYVFLKAGESITKSMDLFQFYQPKEPGKYKITVYYQADEKLKNRLESVWQGILSSEPVSIEVLPGKIFEKF